MLRDLQYYRKPSQTPTPPLALTTLQRPPQRFSVISGRLHVLISRWRGICLDLTQWIPFNVSSMLRDLQYYRKPSQTPAPILALTALQRPPQRFSVISGCLGSLLCLRSGFTFTRYGNEGGRLRERKAFITFCSHKVSSLLGLDQACRPSLRISQALRSTCMRQYALLMLNVET